MKALPLLGILVLISSLLSAQNIGINVDNPSLKLSVNGRMRLQSIPGQSARLGFKASSSDAATLLAVDDNTLGVYGSHWGLMLGMDIVNGRIGINTLTPSAALDINGGLRLRGGQPEPGAVLTSLDASGNATWKGPVSFRVAGTVGEQQFTVTAAVPTQLLNFATVEYNLGNGWQPAYRQFAAPIKGIYHFTANIQVVDSEVNQVLSVAKATPQGVDYIYRKDMSQYIGSDHMLGAYNMTVCLDVQLNAGEQIWLRMENGGDNTTKCSGSKTAYYFTGQLVALL